MPGRPNNLSRAVMSGVFAVAVGVTGIAHAGSERADRAFERLDADGDGLVTQTDFDTRKREMFERLDTDSSNTLTEEELKAGAKEMRKRHREHRKQRMAQHRGQHADKVFEKLDADGDGNVSKAEFEAAQDARESRRAAKKDRREGKKERREKRRERIADIDANNDGIITWDEFSEHGPDGSRLLARLDQDGDGAVSRDEMPERGGLRGRR